MPIRKDKPRKCKNPSCKKTFTPQYSTVQPVCSPKCAIEYNRFMEEKKAAKEWRKEKKEMKKKLETKTDLEKKLQKEINTIVRLIDKGHSCISSGRPLGKNYDAGHLYTTKAHPTIRFHLFNIFAQSVHDNQHKGGNELEYFMRLKEVFSEEIQDYISELKQTPSLHLSKDELRDLATKARGIIKWLKLQDRQFTKEERISLRNRFQEELGIYPPMTINI